MWLFPTEDKRLLQIFLVKVDKTASSCWPSLLTNRFEANPYIKDEMEKKLTLQRFQLEVDTFNICEFVRENLAQCQKLNTQERCLEGDEV